MKVMSAVRPPQPVVAPGEVVRTNLLWVEVACGGGAGHVQVGAGGVRPSAANAAALKTHVGQPRQGHVSAEVAPAGAAKINVAMRGAVAKVEPREENTTEVPE